MQAESRNETGQNFLNL